MDKVDETSWHLRIQQYAINDARLGEYSPGVTILGTAPRHIKFTMPYRGDPLYELARGVYDWAHQEAW